MTRAARGRIIQAIQPYGGAVVPQTPPRFPHSDGGAMRETDEQDTEHDGVDEPEAPVSPETVIDGEQDEDEAEDAETGAGEPVEGEADAEGDGEGGEPQPGTQAQAKAARDEQKEIEKMFTRFAKHATHHRNRVSEIGGEAAQDLLPCPMCAPDEGQPEIPGFLLPVQPSEEKIANVRAAIGLAPKIDYREDPHSKVCPTCGGLKSVLPAGGDSTTPLLPCADCKAQGWIATDATRGGVPGNGEVTTTEAWQSASPPTLEPDAPEVAALKAAGYTVIAPYSAAS